MREAEAGGMAGQPGVAGAPRRSGWGRVALGIAVGWLLVALGIAVGWLLVALAFWALLLALGKSPLTLLYPYLWLGGIGLPVWRFRRRIERAAQAWRAPSFIKVMALGYLMVLIEEVFAALVNNLTEGFSWVLFLRRIGQFWAFNLFAFTGLFLGWYVLMRWVGYRRTEVFFLAGVFGLIAERVFLALPSNPLGFLLFAPLIIFTYGLIITPAMLSMPERTPRWLWLARYPLAVALPWVCSVPFVGAVAALRAWRPEFFPPRRFIP